MKKSACEPAKSVSTPTSNNPSYIVNLSQMRDEFLHTLSVIDLFAVNENSIFFFGPASFLEIHLT